MKTEILKILKQLHSDPSNVFSIFIKERKSIKGGYFNKHEKAVDKIFRCNGQAEGIYVSLNPCKPNMLAKANNSLKAGEGKPTDKNIICHRHLLIDIDTIRPAGTCSTEMQHKEALKLAEHMKNYLLSEEWPEPSIQGNTGNGANLIYRVPDLPANDDTKKLLQNCLRALNDKFGTETLKIDTAVCDASRLTRVLGTMNRKGDEVPEQGIRHRQSKVVFFSKSPTPVNVKYLQKLAETVHELEGDMPPKGDYESTARVDVRRYLENYSIEIIREKNHEGSTLFCLRHCVFDPSHGPNESAIIQGGDGALTYQCFHDSCNLKTWKDARHVISGADKLAPFMKGKNRGRNSNQEGKKKSPSQADQLITIASSHKLFHDDTKVAYAQVGNESLKIRGSSFKQCLARQLWRTEGKAPNSDALNQALNVIEAQAIFDGECIKLYNRVAEHEGNFYFDLSNSKAVKITKSGWSIVDTFPILFKRHAHQQQQVLPKTGGDISRLFKYLNVTNKMHRLLTAVYLVSCFVPNIPHPIFHPWGDQGSGKTTLFIFFKLILDPSKIYVLITPRDHTEVVQTLEHHYICLFDNLSSFPDWLSDLFSQACTGGGFSKRKLYTDDDDVIYQIMRCIGINGINLLIGKPDLMDRTILLHLERIEPSQRKEYKVIMDDFERDRPYILGACLDILSKAMNIYPAVELTQLPRMADFMRWGVAIAQALGYKTEDFISAYHGNVESQNAEVINSNTLAQAVLQFMSDREKWEGTVKEGYEALSALVTVTKEDRTFPKHYNKLRRALGRIKPNLLDMGIKFTLADFNIREGVPMSFQKIGKTSSLSSQCKLSNTINDLEREDTVKTSEDTPKVSSHHNLLTNKDCEDCEDKIPILEGEV